MGPIFKDLYKLYPNDMDLGSQCRILCKHLNHKGLIEMSKKYPNDMELGSELRKELTKLIK